MKQGCDGMGQNGIGCDEIGQNRMAWAGWAG